MHRAIHKLRIIILASILALSAIATSIQPASAVNGNFWFYDGLNATGCWRSENMSDNYQNLDPLFFHGGGGTCTSERVDNRYESIKFQCSSMDNNDYVKIWTGYNYGGTWTIIPYENTLCSGGYAVVNFGSSYRNTVSSFDPID